MFNIKNIKKYVLATFLVNLVLFYASCNTYGFTIKNDGNLFNVGIYTDIENTAFFEYAASLQGMTALELENKFKTHTLTKEEKSFFKSLYKEEAKKMEPLCTWADPNQALLNTLPAWSYYLLGPVLNIGFAEILSKCNVFNNYSLLMGNSYQFETRSDIDKLRFKYYSNSPYILPGYKRIQYIDIKNDKNCTITIKNNGKAKGLKAELSEECIINN